MEILAILAGAVVAMLIVARFDNGSETDGQPYQCDREPGFLSDDDTRFDPVYSHQPDNFTMKIIIRKVNERYRFGK